MIFPRMRKGQVDIDEVEAVKMVVLFPENSHEKGEGP